jgi:hypothetical protein
LKICILSGHETGLQKLFSKMSKTARQNQIKAIESIVSLSQSSAGQGWDKRGTDWDKLKRAAQVRSCLTQISCSRYADLRNEY